MIYINLLKEMDYLENWKNSELLNNIKSAGIILKPSSPELKETYLNIKAFLKKLILKYI